MASLLDRMQVDSSERLGPARTRKTKNDRSPYERPPPLPKGDVNSEWKHDMFPLEGRLGNSASARAAPKYNTSSVTRALSATAPSIGSELSIKGASAQNNVVEVRGLVAGTTAEDVKAIFSQCGPVIEAVLTGPRQREDPIVRLVFKKPGDAQVARTKYDGQHADGKQLSVKILGAHTTSLTARIAHDIKKEGTVDALLSDAPSSKMRSDALLGDARAIVQVVPPGANPADYAPRAGGGGRGRPGRGRGARRGGNGGRRRGGAGGAGGMDIDS